MELNETLIDDIKLCGELSKKPTTCFGKMTVQKDLNTVNEKCQYYKKKVNQIYNNFDIWDGVGYIKPVLPKPKVKEKSERAKKKNFVLENVNKFKIPFFNMIVKSVAVSSVNERSDVSGNSSSILRFKSNRKSDNQPFSSNKKREHKPVLSKFMAINENVEPEIKDPKTETLNNVSFSGKSTITQQSQKQVSLYSKLQNKKNISNFFLTDVSESKLSKFVGNMVQNIKKTNKSDEFGENDSVVINNEGLKKSLNQIHHYNKPMNVKLNRHINPRRPKSMAGGKSIWPIIKEEDTNLNQLSNLMRKGKMWKKIDKKSKEKVQINQNNQMTSNENKETDEIILSSNGFITTCDDFQNKARIKTISRDSNKSLIIKSGSKTPNKLFTLTQTENISSSTKNTSEINLKNIISHIHQLTDTNSIINDNINKEKKFYDGINCDMKEDYTKFEREQLKDCLPKKNVVGEITTKGQKRYISKSRADLIRLSDSVIKLGAENVYKFYNMLSDKYEGYAKEAEIEEVEFEKKKNMLRIKYDNLKGNNLRMRSLAENINSIYTRNCKTTFKKHRKSDEN